MNIQFERGGKTVTARLDDKYGLFCDNCPQRYDEGKLSEENKSYGYRYSCPTFGSVLGGYNLDGKIVTQAKAFCQHAAQEARNENQIQK